MIFFINIKSGSIGIVKSSQQLTVNGQQLTIMSECNRNRYDVQEVCAIPGKIEQFPRELKQLTGRESCQCFDSCVIPGNIEDGLR